MFCTACGAESKTDEEQKAHLNTTRHLIATRNMWREFLEHPARKNKLSTRTLTEAQAAVAEIDRQLAILNQKEG